MINDELKDAAIWPRANKRSLDTRKTHCMLFSNKKVTGSNITIEINSQSITCVTKSKVLGVIIDNKLSWNDYIFYVGREAAKRIKIISNVRRYLNKKALLVLYYSFIYPYQTYFNRVWGTFLSIIHECPVEDAKSYHNNSLCSPKNTYWSIVHET